MSGGGKSTARSTLASRLRFSGEFDIIDFIFLVL